MALSLQRTALIIVMTKLMLIAVIGIMSGNTADFQSGDLTVLQSQTKESQKTILDHFFEGTVDTSNTYNEKSIGDEKMAFEMSVWGALSLGVVGWLPLSWMGDSSEEYALYFFLSIVLTAITMIAYFEILQIARGKTT